MCVYINRILVLNNLLGLIFHKKKTIKLSIYICINFCCMSKERIKIFLNR